MKTRAIIAAGVALLLGAALAVAGTTFISPLISQVVGTVGYSAVTQVAPAVTSGSAYANNQCIGGLQTISVGAPSTGTAIPQGQGGTNGSVVLHDVLVTDSSAQGASTNLFIFDANPTNSTFTDKSTCTINSADYGKIRAVVQISTYVKDGAAAVSVGWVQGVNKQLNLGNGTSFYAVAVSNGATPTYTSTSALQFTYSVIY
jgi:hypothetical protein